VKLSDGKWFDHDGTRIAFLKQAVELAAQVWPGCDAPPTEVH
jgi:hypothetical protein